MIMRHAGISIFLHRKNFRNLWLGSVISGLEDELGAAAVLWMVITHTTNNININDNIGQRRVTLTPLCS